MKWVACSSFDLPFIYLSYGNHQSHPV